MPPTDPDVARHVAQLLLHVGGGASYQQLQAWGVQRWTIERMCDTGQLIRLSRAAFVLPWTAPEDASPWQRARSEHLRHAAALAAQGAVVALRSSALAWGLPVDRIPPHPELLRPPGSGHLSQARTIRRPIPEERVRTVRGVRVTSIERTAVDVAADLPTPQALVTLDAVVRRGVPPEHLRSLLHSLGRVRGCRTARQTLEWADPHSESALESAGRGELLVRGAPPPLCNVSFRVDGTEFRVDDWWPQFALAGEADGRLKYSGDAEPTSLWKEKLRQEWFEEVLGLPIFRYIDSEVRLTPDALFERWKRKADRAGRQQWTPPPELEIFQRPPPGSTAPWRWFRHRHDAGTPRSA